MPARSLAPLVALLGLVACGGSNSSSTTNPFLGTLNITSAAATNTCLATHTVRFGGAGVDKHDVTAAGGDCVDFVNDDTAAHQPASNGTPACPELDGPSIPHLGHWTTGLLSGPKTCHWEDFLNPPGAGGGGGY